jgi:hypothetical protein
MGERSEGSSLNEETNRDKYDGSVNFWGGSDTGDVS